MVRVLVLVLVVEVVLADRVVLLADLVAMLAQKQDARSMLARQQAAWTVEMAAVDRTAVDVQSWFVYERRESGSLTVSAQNPRRNDLQATRPILTSRRIEIRGGWEIVVSAPTGRPPRPGGIPRTSTRADLGRFERMSDGRIQRSKGPKVQRSTRMGMNRTKNVPCRALGTFRRLVPG